MKLLFLDDRLPFYLGDKNYPVGGASIRVYALANGLTKLGHQVGLLTWKGAAEHAGDIKEFEFVESYNLNGGFKGFRFFERRYRMLRSIKQYNPDFVFQISAAVNTGVMGIIANMLKIPFVYLAASNADADGKYAEYLPKSEQKLYRLGLRKSSMIISQNQYQYEYFKRQFPKKNITLVHNPFFYEHQLPELKNFLDRKYVAWVGNFSKVKNLPAAFEIILALGHIKFKLAGVETNKTDQATVVALEKLKQLKNVEFVGHLGRNEVIPFLSEAYALFNTSNLEGFSNTFLEALAVGTPVVTRKDLDPDHILETNNLGNIVEDNSQIGEAILKTINPETFDIQAANCKAYLLENHSTSFIAQSLVDKIASIT